MEFIPYRMLRNEPSALRKKLSDQGELIVTVEGKPFAAMIDLSNINDIEDVLILLSRLKAQMALRAVRSQARIEGKEKLTDAEIDSLVNKSRQERTK
jgi:hypothetical protein